MADSKSDHALEVFQLFFIRWNTELLCSFIKKSISA